MAIHSNKVGKVYAVRGTSVQTRSLYAECQHILQSVKSILPLEDTLKEHGIEYTKSKSGRAALFFRDPDQNVLEMAEQ